MVGQWTEPWLSEPGNGQAKECVSRTSYSNSAKAAVFSAAFVSSLYLDQSAKPAITNDKSAITFEVI